MSFLRMTTRRWMIAVAVAAIALTARADYPRRVSALAEAADHERTVCLLRCRAQRWIMDAEQYDSPPLTVEEAEQRCQDRLALQRAIAHYEAPGCGMVFVHFPTAREIETRYDGYSRWRKALRSYQKAARILADARDHARLARKARDSACPCATILPGPLGKLARAGAASEQRVIRIESKLNRLITAMGGPRPDR